LYVALIGVTARVPLGNDQPIKVGTGAAILPGAVGRAAVVAQTYVAEHPVDAYEVQFERF
jgi:hypothetical protein